MIRLGSALALLISLSSCARLGAGEPKPDVVSTRVTAPPPTGSDQPPAMRPNRATPDPRATELTPARWTHVRAGTGHEMLVQYTITGRGDCSALGRTDVTETATTVTVTLHLGRLPGADCDGPQSQLAAVMTTVVTLRQPLGDRTVHDGAA